MKNKTSVYLLFYLGRLSHLDEIYGFCIGSLKDGKANHPDESSRYVSTLSGIRDGNCHYNDRFSRLFRGEENVLGMYLY